MTKRNMEEIINFGEEWNDLIKHYLTYVAEGELAE